MVTLLAGRQLLPNPLLRQVLVLLVLLGLALTRTPLPLLLLLKVAAAAAAAATTTAADAANVTRRRAARPFCGGGWFIPFGGPIACVWIKALGCPIVKSFHASSVLGSASKGGRSFITRVRQSSGREWGLPINTCIKGQHIAREENEQQQEDWTIYKGATKTGVTPDLIASDWQAAGSAAPTSAHDRQPLVDLPPHDDRRALTYTLMGLTV